MGPFGAHYFLNNPVSKIYIYVGCRTISTYQIQNICGIYLLRTKDNQTITALQIMEKEKNGNTRRTLDILNIKQIRPQFLLPLLHRVMPMHHPPVQCVLALL